MKKRAQKRRLIAIALAVAILAGLAAAYPKGLF